MTVTSAQMRAIERNLQALAAEAADVARGLEGKVPPVGHHTPRGPARWERAALNAVKRPRSAAARLYTGRVANARQLADAMEAAGDDVNSPWQFNVDRVRMVSRTCSEGHSHYNQESYYEREFAACSAYCMFMLVQLDASGRRVPSLEDFSAILNRQLWSYDDGVRQDLPMKRVTPLDVTSLVRPLSCKCCGGKVWKR